MYALSRGFIGSTRRIASRGARRHASGHAHDSHAHTHPVEESLGTQFYVVIATIPLGMGIYYLSRPAKDGSAPAFTKWINSYASYNEKWAARNTLHTTAVEAAAYDRNLFQSSPGSAKVELKFPEVFNTGSPYNVSAGQHPRDMDQLIAHYQKLNAEDEERRLQSIAEN